MIVRFLFLTQCRCNIPGSSGGCGSKSSTFGTAELKKMGLQSLRALAQSAGVTLSPSEFSDKRLLVRKLLSASPLDCSSGQSNPGKSVDSSPVKAPSQEVVGLEEMGVGENKKKKKKEEEKEEEEEERGSWHGRRRCVAEPRAISRR